MSDVSDDKLAAYRNTDYRVGREPCRFVLRIGIPSPHLQTLYASAGHASAAFITAFNPHGEQQDDALNEAAHARLGEQLRQSAVIVIEGEGVATEGNWPPEKSFLVIGLSCEAAAEIGRAARQDAIVWAGEDALPELVVLR
jgi:hypothetical protein